MNLIYLRSLPVASRRGQVSGPAVVAFHAERMKMDSAASIVFEPIDIRAIPDDQLDDILGGYGNLGPNFHKF